MKALRYLLIAVMLSMTSIWGVAYATAQGLAKQPKTEMRSTSVMPGAGSDYSSAAVNGGPVLAGSAPSAYAPANAAPSGPNRAKRGLDDGDDDIPPQEQPFPLGDAALPLMFLACVYMLAHALLKKRA